MRPRIVLVAVLCTISVVTSRAQVRVVRYGDDRLSGIHEVDVVVHTTSPNGEWCGPSRETLQSVTRDTLQNAALQATVSQHASSWFYSVVLRALGARVDNGCVTALIIELVAEVQGIPEADRSAVPGAWGSLLVGHMPLVATSRLVTTPEREHDSAVREVVRDQVTHIATRLRAANP